MDQVNAPVDSLDRRYEALVLCIGNAASLESLSDAENRVAETFRGPTVTNGQALVRLRSMIQAKANELCAKMDGRT